MGVLDTTYTFTATDLVTSAKLNNVIDQTTFTATAITGTTLAVSESGQLRVNASGITPMQVANGDYSINVTGSSASCTGNAATATSVAYTGLTGTIPTWNQNTTGNAATVTTVTSTSLADNSVTTIKILDGNVTQAKIGANVVGKGAFVRVVGSTTPFPASGQGAAIAFANVQSDFYNNWNSATNTFTCPVSGIYLVTCRVAVASTPISGLTPLILINGINQIIPSEVIANTYSSGITDMFSLNANDTMRGGVFAQTSGTLANASLSISLIRPM